LTIRHPEPMNEESQITLTPKSATVPITPMPLSWRGGIAFVVVALACVAYLLQGQIGPRGQAALGVCCFLGLIAACSSNLRAVNWRTIGWGFTLQVLLAVGVIWVPPVRDFFEAVVGVVKQLLAFTNAGSEFVFGELAKPKAMEVV